MRDWQPVVGYEGKYEVSRDGRVCRVDGRPVGQWLNDSGYSYVRLSQPRAMWRVHRLVALAFIPNPAELPDINHINSDRADNRAENLEWCSQQQNIAHGAAKGHMRRVQQTGALSRNARLSDEQVAAIRYEYAIGLISWEALGRKFGMSKRAIGRIVRRETYV